MELMAGYSNTANPTKRTTAARAGSAEPLAHHGINEKQRADRNAHHPTRRRTFMTYRRWPGPALLAFTLAAAGCSSTHCASQPGPSATPVSSPSKAASGPCAGDTVAAQYLTTFDGTQPLCLGFPGDADHAGEGLRGAETDLSVHTVVTSMLSRARAIYSFQPTQAWLAANPHPRDVNNFFHRQTTPLPGDTAMRAYKDYLTPAPGQPRNEQDFALVAVIVTTTPQPGHDVGVSVGGVWFIGCLTFHADRHEYLDTCPSWVWTVPLVPSTKHQL